jgi:ATP-dependent Lon protease
VVLPIGGLKEKLLAAHRGGVKTVLIPHENVKDLAEELPEEVKGEIEIIPVRWIDEVLDRALETKPVPLTEEAPATPPPAAPAPPADGAVVKH